MLLSHMSSLHIGGISPLFDRWFANIFTHSVDCLFILLTVSFSVQKLCSLIWSNLFNFAFCNFCFWCHIQKFIAKSTMLRSFFPVLSPSSFIISSLLFSHKWFSFSSKTHSVPGVWFHFVWGDPGFQISSGSEDTSFFPILISRLHA